MTSLNSKNVHNQEEEIWLILQDLLNKWLAEGVDTDIMAIRIVEFSCRGYKIRKIFALESTYPEEIYEFLVLD